jgi:site-specific DNA-methyltransferase (adenine-specific)
MIYHLDAMSLTPDWVSQCQVMITDPPYSAHVHGNAISQSKGGGTRERDFGFGYLTPKLRRQVAMCAANVQRWSVIYSDVESSTWMRIACQAQKARYIRTMPWLRWSMPQMTGTIPPQGFEHLLVFTNKTGWNGPGNATDLRHELPEYLDHTCLRGYEKHKAEKPLDQALDLVSWFSNPGDRVLDLFAGSGVFGLACALLGRTYVGIELDPIWVERGTAREQIANISEADLRRVERFVNAQDDSAMTKPSEARQVKRQADRMAVIAAL